MSESNDLEKGGEDIANKHKIEPFVAKNLDRPSSAALVDERETINQEQLRMYGTQRHGFGTGNKDEYDGKEDSHAEEFSVSKKLGFGSDEDSDDNKKSKAKINNYSIEKDAERRKVDKDNIKLKSGYQSKK